MSLLIKVAVYLVKGLLLFPWNFINQAFSTTKLMLC